MRIAATFVRSAAGAEDFPRDGAPEIALVGRSNVGKSTLINALVRQRVARTSAAPGKTRLANIYRVERGGSPAFYLVDLPGYGYARGGAESAREFDELTRAYFVRPSVARGFSPAEAEDAELKLRATSGATSGAASGATSGAITALLLVDSRHPGMESDLAAWRWLRGTVDRAAVVATKIDKLTRGERIRALRELESVFEHPAAPVSAVTGEGLDELWKVIDRLANNSNSRTDSRNNLPRAATVRRRPKN